MVPCGDAETGFELFQRDHPPLLLLDLILPGMEGLDLVRKIRAAPGGESPIIVVVTIRDEPAVHEQILDAGANDYLPKPIRVDHLDIRLAVAERSVRMERERRAARDALRRRTRELEALFENLDEGFFSVDLSEERLIQASSGVTRLLGEPPGEEGESPASWQRLLSLLDGSAEPRSGEGGPASGDPEVDDDIFEELGSGRSVKRIFVVEPPTGRPRWIEATLKAETDPLGRPVRLDGVLTDVTERRLAQTELAERNRELASLYRVSEITLAAPSADEAYDLVLEEISRTLGYSIALIARLDPDRNVLAVAAARGLDLPDDEAVEIPLEGTLPGRTVLEARHLVATPHEGTSLGHELLSSADLRSWLAFPLSTRESVDGILALADAELRDPDAATLQRGMSLAGTVAAFIERTSAEQALKESERRFRSLTGELRRANLELESFAYSVSHDLRAPLRTMQGFAHTLLREYGEELEPDARDHVQRIIRSGQQSERLISDLLDYSRLSSEEVELEPVDLGEVVRSAVQGGAADIEERAAEISVVEPLPTVQGHRLTLLQVVSNLLSNAVKFVPEDRTPEVTIRAEERGDSHRLWVEDNGIGIPEERRDRIFRVFERLGGDVAKRPGTGIGLAIVRRGMQKIGGRSGVDARDGGGSAFWVELPKSPEPRHWNDWRGGGASPPRAAGTD